MSVMLSCYASLKSLDLFSFNTIKVNDMNSLFYYCSSLKILDLTSFNVIDVKYMNNMVSHCL